MEDPDLRDVARVVPQQDLLPHVGRQRRVDVAQPREPDAVGVDPPRLRDRQQQQVELLQRLGHARQEAAGRPPLLRLESRRRVGLVVVLVDQEPLQFGGQRGQRQLRFLDGSARPIAGQPREEHLGDALEEPLDLAPASGPSDHRVDQADLEVGGDLLEVPGREVAPVVGIEDPGMPQTCQPGRPLRQIACRSARAVWIADGSENDNA